MKLLASFIFLILSLNAFSQSPMQKQMPYEKGLHYTEITPHYPTRNEEKVVVYEFFGYMCPHCASFQPYMNSWHKKKPANVELIRVPVMFQPGWEVFAKAYYAAESMGIIEKTHQKTFDAIHKQRNRFRTIEDIADWYESELGVNKEKFISTSKSFMIDSKLRQANSMMKKMGIRSTPSVVVNGKYLLNGKTLGGANGILELATHLTSEEIKLPSKSDRATTTTLSNK